MQGIYLYQTQNQSWLFNSSWSPAIIANSTLPPARSKHSGAYFKQRLFFYGGNDEHTIIHNPTESKSVLQLSISYFCNLYGVDCGNCLLYCGCGYCQMKRGSNITYKCFPGETKPYLNSSCSAVNDTYSSNVLDCRTTRNIPALIPVTCVVVILITILVVATYVVDWKLQKKKSMATRGYEYIG